VGTYQVKLDGWENTRRRSKGGAACLIAARVRSAISGGLVGLLLGAVGPLFVDISSALTNALAGSTVLSVFLTNVDCRPHSSRRLDRCDDHA